MKKIIIAKDIRASLDGEQSFLDRSTMNLLTVNSHEEAIDLHKNQKADLIITNLDMTDLPGEEFCSIIRGHEELRSVSIIVVCPDDLSDTKRIDKCRANALIARPVNSERLFRKAQELLNIQQRGMFRTPVSVKVQGEYSGKAFFCLSENISASGMLFVTDKELRQGDRILCSFVLPDSSRIRTYADIVRITARKDEFDVNGYGIKFIDLEDQSRHAISVFVEHMTKVR